MSQGARVSWDVCRSWRATDQKASDSVSSPLASPRPVVSLSWVTGIAYQQLLLYPHVEVTSTMDFSGRPSGRVPFPDRIEQPLGVTTHESRRQ